MTRQERRLLRHLVLAMLIKLALLTALWWMFVRDVHVAALAEQAAAWLTHTSDHEHADH